MTAPDGKTIADDQIRDALFDWLCTAYGAHVDVRLADADALAALATTGERQRLIGELRAFADDLYGVTGARWIADTLTATLDRLSEENEPR